MKRLFILLVGFVLIGIVLAEWWVHSPYYGEVRMATTFITVDASADKVWQTLEATGDYSQWNPYIARVDGTLAAGARLRVVEKFGGKNHTYSVLVTRFQPSDRQFAWAGSTWFPALLRWSESFVVEPIDATHCRVDISQGYQGVLLRSFWNNNNQKALSAVKQMGQALKKRAAQS